MNIECMPFMSHVLPLGFCLGFWTRILIWNRWGRSMVIMIWMLIYYLGSSSAKLLIFIHVNIVLQYYIQRKMFLDNFIILPKLITYWKSHAICSRTDSFLLIFSIFCWSLILVFNILISVFLKNYSKLLLFCLIKIWHVKGEASFRWAENVDLNTAHRDGAICFVPPILAFIGSMQNSIF